MDVKIIEEPLFFVGFFDTSRKSLEALGDALAEPSQTAWQCLAVLERLVDALGSIWGVLKSLGGALGGLGDAWDGLGDALEGLGDTLEGPTRRRGRLGRPNKVAATWRIRSLLR